MPIHVRLAGAVAGLVLLAGQGVPAAVHVCAEPRLQVIAEDPVEVRLVCEGAERAWTFLTGLGLAAPPSQVIEVLPSLPPLYGTALLGRFAVETGRVQMLSYPACGELARRYPQFGQPMDADLYRSFVAHEVAHALVAANYTGQGSAVLAQEYLAYTSQFVAMPAALRERILTASRVSAFRDEHAMSETLYFLDPHAFAVASYRHFGGLADPRGFVWKLLSGELKRSPRL